MFHLLSLKTTFEDVYGTGFRKVTYEKYTQRITTTEANVYVYDCVFSGCTGTSSGGALFCGDTIYRLLVEQSSFISCKSIVYTIFTTVPIAAVAGNLPVILDALEAPVDPPLPLLLTSNKNIV